MIKQLLSICAVASIVTVNAQSARTANSNKSINLKGGLSAVSSVSCTQITTQTTNSLTVNVASSGTACPGGGFVNGTNCYGDLQKANYFPASTYSAVTSPSITNVAIGFFKSPTRGTSGTVNTVTMSIFSGSMTTGPTGAAIGTATASLAQIIGAQPSPTVTSFVYTFSLSTPVVAPAGGFFAALTVPNTPGDTVVILNQTSAPANFGWEMQSDNNWYNMGSAQGWGTAYKADLSFYPNICGSAIATGISKNLGLSKNITIMPNPSNGLVNVSLAVSENITLTVTNALGQQVFANKYDAISNESISLDLTSQANGIYFITVSNGTDKMVQRLIINK